MVRRQRRYNSYDSYSSINKDEILLAEFLFYNKTRKVISNSVINKIIDVLAKKEKKKIYWTNKQFGESGIGFCFKRRDLNLAEGTYETYIEIVDFGEVKIDPKNFNEICDLINNRIALTFELEYGQNKIIENLDINSNIAYEGDEKDFLKNICHNWEELVNYLIVNNMLPRYDYNDDWEDYKKDIKLIFPDFEFAPKIRYSVQGDRYNSDNLYHIIEVIEKRINDKNYRISLQTKFSYSDPEYGIRTVPDSDEEYLRIDVQRIYFRESRFFYLDIELNEYTDNGSLIINGDVFKEMKRNINRILDADNNVITRMIYEFYNQRAIRMESGDESLLDIRQRKINEQYKNLLNTGVTIKIGNVIMNRKRIEILGEGFSMDFDEDFLDVGKNFFDIKKALDVGDAKYNFNTIFENLLKLSCLKVVSKDWIRDYSYRDFSEVRFKVNDMDIRVHKDNNRMKINGIFSRIEDVYYILTKLICYHDVTQFNKYVKDVSYIGIDWKRMISNGIAIELNNPFFKIFQKTGQEGVERLYMRFSLLWDKDKRNQVYLLLNQKKYLIKYKGKFKKHFNVPRRAISMALFKRELGECLVNLDDNTIVEIVENAIAEAKIILERGIELVRETVKDIKAEEVELEIGGNQIKGYQFTGLRTGGKYFINKANLAVFKFIDGSWNRRCVIDDHSKQRIFEDKLANRLANIYNEPAYISTIR